MPGFKVRGGRRVTHPEPVSVPSGGSLVPVWAEMGGGDGVLPPCLGSLLCPLPPSTLLIPWAPAPSPFPGPSHWACSPTRAGEPWALSSKLLGGSGCNSSPTAGFQGPTGYKGEQGEVGKDGEKVPWAMPGCPLRRWQLQGRLLGVGGEELLAASGTHRTAPRTPPLLAGWPLDRLCPLQPALAGPTAAREGRLQLSVSPAVPATLSL